MQIFEYPKQLEKPWRDAIFVLGNLDGVHIAHQYLIGCAKKLAAQCGNFPVGVITFEPHPRQYFAPGSPPFRLTPRLHKRRYLYEASIDLLVELPFDQQMALRSAQGFVEDLLVSDLGIAGLVVGEGFKFGQNRLGDVALLKNYAGFETQAVEAVKDRNDEIISSSRIREALSIGDLRSAKSLLGRDWEIEGEVVYGEQRGRSLGFPTANIELGEYLCAKKGVYAVQISYASENFFDSQVKFLANGVANIGDRPTVNGEKTRLEVHLFDFDGNLYGKKLRIMLKKFIRPEQKFGSLEDLQAEIGKDCTQARTQLQ